MQKKALTLPRRLAFRKLVASTSYILFLASILIGVCGLLILLVTIFVDGIGALNWNFVTSFPSRHPDQAGIKAALFGTVWLVGLTAVITVPLGVATAIYLEEYAGRNWFTRIIEVNIANLAGVPSIVYGLLGLAIFVQWMALGRSILAGALTMSLLALPIVIIASREAIRAVPDSHRQAAYALGSTKWQAVKGVVLPSAFPGILTGTILAMSRAIGEAAPVLAISALVYLTFVPSDPLERFTVLPIQIFNWISRPQAAFRELAAAGIIVLLIVLLSMNAVAIYLRNRYQVRSEE